MSAVLDKCTRPCKALVQAQTYLDYLSSCLPNTSEYESISTASILFGIKSDNNRQAVGRWWMETAEGNQKWQFHSKIISCLISASSSFKWVTFLVAKSWSAMCLDTAVGDNSRWRGRSNKYLAGWKTLFSKLVSHTLQTNKCQVLHVQTKVNGIIACLTVGKVTWPLSDLPCCLFSSYLELFLLHYSNLYIS